MTEVYRCKVRKPNGEIVDGCGLEFTLPELGGSSKCSCGGFFRRKDAEPQIHGGPLVVEAHRSTQAGSPEDLDNRSKVLAAVGGRLLALRAVAAVQSWKEGVTASEDNSVRECIALLQSLLPASPEADSRAQVDMAAEHNARADVEEVAARLTGEYLRGGWSVPSNTLNAFFRQAFAHGKASR